MDHRTVPEPTPGRERGDGVDDPAVRRCVVHRHRVLARGRPRAVRRAARCAGATRDLPVLDLEHRGRRFRRPPDRRGHVQRGPAPGRTWGRGPTVRSLVRLSVFMLVLAVGACGDDDATAPSTTGASSGGLEVLGPDADVNGMSTADLLGTYAVG